jgi:hypothetical protein
LVFSEIFSGKSEIFGCAKVGELYAMALENEKISVLAG